MKRFPHDLAELIARIGDFSADEQRAAHMIITKRMLDAATLKQVKAIRADCRTSYLCEWLGEEHRARVLNMIEGHVALRRMGLIRRERRTA